MTTESANSAARLPFTQMLSRANVLAALELACFAAISGGVAVAGWAFAGPMGGVASGLIAGGAAGVYLVNVYSMPTPEEEPPDD